MRLDTTNDSLECIIKFFDCFKLDVSLVVVSRSDCHDINSTEEHAKYQSLTINKKVRI